MSVTDPKITENVELRFKLFVKYHGMAIILTPEEIPEIICAKNKRRSLVLFFNICANLAFYC